jgi:hypothetical protein
MFGDKSLHAMIDVAAAPISPTAPGQLSRASDTSLDTIEYNEARRKRIKREDLEMVKLQEEIQEKRIKNFKDAMGLLAEISPDWHKSDGHFRMQTEDMIKNIITLPVTASRLTNDKPESGKQASLPGSITQLAQDSGLESNCKRSFQPEKDNVLSQLCTHTGASTIHSFLSAFVTKHLERSDVIVKIWASSFRRDLHSFQQRRGVNIISENQIATRINELGGDNGFTHKISHGFTRYTFDLAKMKALLIKKKVFDEKATYDD